MNPLDKRPDGIPAEEWQAHLNSLNNPAPQVEGERYFYLDGDDKTVVGIDGDLDTPEGQKELDEALRGLTELEATFGDMQKVEESAGETGRKRVYEEGWDVVEYQCQRRCLLATAVRVESGLTVLVPELGFTEFRVPVESLGSIDTDAARTALRRAQEFKEVHGVGLASWKPESKKEWLDLNRAGAPGPHRAWRLFELPARVNLSCEHRREVQLDTGQIAGDIEQARKRRSHGRAYEIKLR